METERILLETDYLVIGAGATGMSFVDEILNSSSDIRFIIIDKHAKPGGHWNDAYEFVTLHQPASFYGVGSKTLGDGGKDLVSRAQILAYYELVMKDFLATGRVNFYPQCEFTSNGVFVSLLDSDVKYEVNVVKKTVDAKYAMPEVPSIVKPEFKISDGVHFVPVNGLSRIQSPWKRYVIIGGGKTGIDAILFLLAQNVNSDRIIWIVPNDMWMVNRLIYFGDNIANFFKDIMNIFIECESHDEFYERGESRGFFMRLDANRKPTRMKGATVTVEEMENLRKITHIVRQGRIERIEPSCIVFKDGSEIETDGNTLHVDCSANGIKNPPKRAIYDGNTIYLQSVTAFQPVYSASIIAAYEYRFPDDEDKKNELCKPIAHPTYPFEYVTCIRIARDNEDAVGKVLGMSWIRGNRLNYLCHASSYSFFSLVIYMWRYKDAIMESFDRIIGNIEEVKST